MSRKGDSSEIVQDSEVYSCNIFEVFYTLNNKKDTFFDIMIFWLNGSLTSDHKIRPNLH